MATIFHISSFPFGPAPGEPDIHAIAGYVTPLARSQNLSIHLSRMGWTVFYFDPQQHQDASGMARGEYIYRIGGSFYVTAGKIIPELVTLPIVLWLDHPMSADLIGQSNEDLVVYDEGCTLPEGTDDTALKARADVILCATRASFAETSTAFPGKAYMAPNGCDYGHFAREAPQPIPEDLPTGKPILGFFGSLAPWVDWQLIADVADLLPDWQIVMIGTKYQRQPLVNKPNIRYLGHKSHKQLPEYLAHFEVAMCPYQTTGLGARRSPTKVYEYLAGGVPVVATSLPEMESFGDVVTCADGAEAFADAVRQARATNSPALVTGRSEAVKEHSLIRRAQAVSAILEERLQAVASKG